MQIFKNTNYDFIRGAGTPWRCRRLVILAGFGLMVARGGMPLGIDFSGGTIVVLKFDQAERRRTPSATALDVAARREGRPELRRRRRDNEMLVRLPQARQGRGLQPRAGRRAGRRRAARRPTSASSRCCQHRGRRPGHRRGPAAQGHLRDAGLDHRHHASTSRCASGRQLRGRRHRRDVPRHPRDARVPGVLRLRAVAEHRRRHPDDHRLLGQRHDRHLRPRAREPAQRCGATRSRQVVNTSVNQTLGRTIITAGTTFLAVLALYLFGGEVLHGFAFTMLVGIVSGTYSTVFIAAAVAHPAASARPARARRRRAQPQTRVR